MLDRLLEVWNGECFDVDVKCGNKYFYDDLITRQWQTKRQHHSKVAMSQLGKPVVLQWLKKNYPLKEELGGRLRWIFSEGDYFEQLVVDVAKSMGYKLRGSQTTLELEGTREGDVATGHIDGIVKEKGQDYVLEVKTMSSYYFKKFTKEPDDERGYLTQLSLYCHCLNLPGLWLCIDKANGELAVVELPEEKMDDCVARARDAIDTLYGAANLAAVYDDWSPPRPVPEKFRRQETGRYLLPPDLKYSPYAEHLYKLIEDTNGYNKPTVYVDSFRSPEDVEHSLKRVASLRG